MRTGFAVIFAIAEILAVLIAGNLLGGLTAQAGFSLLGVDPDSLEKAEGLARAGADEALIAGISLTSRFFWMLLLAFLILRFVYKTTPRQAAVSRGGHSWLTLLGAGVLLFAVAGLPQKLALLADSYADFGQGLEGWDSFSQQVFTFGHVLYVLAAMVVLPPLFEEPFARGYMRIRLSRVLGGVGGVIVTAVFFMMSHGHFYVADPLAITVFATTIFAVICWTWVVYRMGSIVPAIIAHSLGNIPAPIEPEILWPSIAAMVLISILFVRKVSREFAAFFRELGEAPKGALVFALALVAGILITIVFYGAATPIIGLVALVLMIIGWFPPMRHWRSGE